MQNRVLLAIGSNLDSFAGSPRETVIESVNELERSDLRVCATSRLFATRAFPPSSGPDYVNAAMVCHSELGPADILEILHRIEAKFARTRGTRWGARTLDLDLLAVGHQIKPDRRVHKFWRELPIADQAHQVPDQLILPHPRLQDRSFVLIPLAEIAPDWMHPVLGLSVTEMLANLPASALEGVKDQ